MIENRRCRQVNNLSIRSAAANEAKKRKANDSMEAKSSAKKKSDRKEGFDRGLVPERIIGATDTSGESAGVLSPGRCC